MEGDEEEVVAVVGVDGEGLGEGVEEVGMPA